MCVMYKFHNKMIIQVHFNGYFAEENSMPATRFEPTIVLDFSQWHICLLNRDWHLSD